MVEQFVSCLSPWDEVPVDTSELPENEWISEPLPAVTGTIETEVGELEVPLQEPYMTAVTQEEWNSLDLGWGDDDEFNL